MCVFDFHQVLLAPAVLGNPTGYSIGSTMQLEIGANNNTQTRLVGYNSDQLASAQTPGICTRAQKVR